MIEQNVGEMLDKLEFAVENFLAVLFRDGGHKTAEFDSLPEALYYARDVALELIHKDVNLQSRIKGMEDLADRDRDEIAKLRTANENNLEGWQQNVAGLQRELQQWQDRCYGAELKNERQDGE